MMTKIKILYDLIAWKKHYLVIDIGCDHGYLSILLIKNEKTDYVLNIDNKILPLKNAINNTNKYNYQNRITNCLNDGLKKIKNKLKNITFRLNPNVIVVAGLGTNKIIDILKNDEISNEKTKFILQSESNISQLKI